MKRGAAIIVRKFPSPVLVKRENGKTGTSVPMLLLTDSTSQLIFLLKIFAPPPCHCDATNCTHPPGENCAFVGHSVESFL